jgi:phenylacetyl-CoA:acceptor oxidoreductase subunit 1
MVADLERCVGCQTCTAACRHANATSPAVQWRRVLDVESGTFPDVRRTFMPVGCQHCDDPPCMHVCPSTATRKRADGIVTIDYDLCIGCAYCDVACPYQARFKISAPSFAYGRSAMPNETEREDPSLIGVAQKCTFCVSRIDSGLARGLQPGVAPEATPACVNACIATALHFGDADDPNSNVSRLLREQKHFRMHEEIGTGPRFYYVYENSIAGQDEAAERATQRERGPVAGRLRSRGVEPSLQQHWDWKAAGNFICGGAGAGLLAVTSVAGLMGMPQALIGIAALSLIALGLILVLLKIGRPWRAMNVLRQPRRSWMAREAWLAAMLFPSAALALWSGNPALVVITGILGLSFLYSQAMILKEAKGIPAWREPRIVPLLIITGLAEGGGLFLMALPLVPALGAMAEPVAIAVTLLAAARSAAHRAYLSALVDHGAPARALSSLMRFREWFLILGLALPLVLIAMGFVASSAAPVLFALGGMSVLASGWTLKFRIVTQAGYNQGFALNNVPMRGSGRAASAARPGWSFGQLAQAGSTDPGCPKSEPAR